ncbi:MAG: hypothetical protein ACHQK9_11245 [Reyranellales bacterium]
MRRLLLLALICTASPAAAQLVVPLATSDGRVACVQGMTGIGRLPVWQAIADPGAQGGWALAETVGDATDLRFPLCMGVGIVVRDVDATLRFKPVSGTHQRSAGLVLRGQDANDYYVTRASAIDRSVRLYRMQGGRRALLASKEAAVKSGEWQTLRMVLDADRFEVSLDGVSLFKGTDRSLLRPGAVGVWSEADSVTYFGSLLVAPAH